MPNEDKHFYEFNGFRLDSEKRLLWRKGEIVPITPKAIEVLILLVEKRGDLLEREELLERVWKDTFVEEANLNFTISSLRKILDRNGKKLIQTVPRRGYRFTGSVHEVSEREPAESIVERHTLVEIEQDEETFEDGPLLSAKASRVKVRTVLISAFVALLGLGLIGASLYMRVGVPVTQGPIKSLAVLPLKSFDKNGVEEALRLRITDALITRLGSLKEIAVRPTNAILRFADGEGDVISAGKEIEVDAVLDGRVQSENGRLRITLQLVSVATGEQLWSEQFDGKADSILALQDEISNRLRKHLAYPGTDNFSRQPTTSNDAYEAYLKGRYFWNQRNPDAYFKAINYFEEAIRLDPNFALAYSGLADSYVLLNRRYVSSSEEALPKAEEAALKALELDYALAEAHNSMGLVRGVYNRNWQMSEDHYRRAIELNPNYAVAHAWYGLAFSAQGRFDEAEAELRKAERLDPTSRNIAVYLALNYYHARQYDRAIEQSRRALELDSKLTTAYVYLSQSFEQKGNFDQAVEADLERQRIISPESVESLRSAYLNSGIKGFWQKQIELRRDQIMKYSGCEYEIATRQAMLHNKNEALRIIENNYRSGGTCWNAVKTEPAFDALRNEPRYKEILRRMNL